MYYTAFVRREGRHWLAVFPDAPGCQTEADSADALRAAAQQALEGWLETQLVVRRLPPKPRQVRKKYGHQQWKIPISASLAAVLQIRWRREELGLSQKQVAERVGVSQQQIAKLEDPDENPTLRTLEKVASALGLVLDVSLQPAA